MYRFEVNGLEIELSKDTKLSFSYENEIFGFDRMQMRRTQAFQIPKTPHNNKIANFAYRPDMYGTEMRNYYTATLWYSSGKVEGRLYIEDADRYNYNAVFVFGELQALRRAKELGKISEYLLLTNELDWKATTPIDTSATASPLGLRQYAVNDYIFVPNNKRNFMPSTSIKYLLDKCADALGITINYGTVLSAAEKYVIKLNGMNERIQIGRSGNIIKRPPPIGIANSFIIASSLMRILTEGSRFEPNIGRYYQVLRAVADFNCHFAFIGTPGTVLTQYRNNDEIISQTVIDDIGRAVWKVEFKQNDVISAYNPNISIDLMERYESVAYNCFATEYFAPTYKAIYPTIYGLQPNLPDVSFIDLLKAVAYINGKAITANGNTVSFVDYEFSPIPIELDGRLISLDKVTRTIGDYAQTNTIKFNSSDKVLNLDKLTLDLAIDNKTLSNDKVLFEIPFSEGNDYIDGFLNMSDVIQEPSGNYSFGNDADALAIIDNFALLRAEFTPPQKLLDIFYKSTTIVVKMRMYLFEYMQIKYNTSFTLYNNTWCAFSTRWQDNIATLTLVKL